MEQRNFSCDDVQAVLSGLLDGELPADVLHGVEVHLVGCEACRALANEAEELDAEVRAVVEVGESDWSSALERRILFAINDPSAELKILTRLRWSAWSGWGTAVAALLMLTFSLMYSGAGEMSGVGGDLVASSESDSIENIAGVDEANDADFDDDEIRMVVIGDGGNVQTEEPLPTNAIATTVDGQRVADAAEGTDEVIENILNDDAPLEGLETIVALNKMAIDVPGDLAGVSERLSAFEILTSRQPVSFSLAEFDDAADMAEEEPFNIEPNLVARVVETDEGEEVVGAEGDEIVPTLIASDWEVGLDDVLYDAAVLLRAIEDAEVDSYTDLREINRVLEYDELLEKLASSRNELWGEDALLVDRAWAVLERVSGPIDQGRLLRVQELLAVDDLAGRLEMMSDQYGTY